VGPTRPRRRGRTREYPGPLRLPTRCYSAPPASSCGTVPALPHVLHARALRTQERQSPQSRSPPEGRGSPQEARGEAGRRDRRGWRALRASGARVRHPRGRTARRPRTSSTATTSRSYSEPDFRPYASTTCATAACHCSPSAASPSGTSRSSPGTRLRRSRCSATPTTTARRPATPPKRWTKPSAEPYC
jgi:hypothetical protein